MNERQQRSHREVLVRFSNSLVCFPGRMDFGARKWLNVGRTAQNKEKHRKPSSRGGSGIQSREISDGDPRQCQHPDGPTAAGRGSARRRSESRIWGADLDYEQTPGAPCKVSQPLCVFVPPAAS